MVLVCANFKGLSVFDRLRVSPRWQAIFYTCDDSKHPKQTHKIFSLTSEYRHEGTAMIYLNLPQIRTNYLLPSLPLVKMA